MTWLLDGNVLVALAIDSHVHHDRAHRWFGTLRQDGFATRLLTQGALLRVHMRSAADRGATAAWRSLQAVADHPRHDWWDDALSFLDVPHRHLQGSAQVTDAWLAELARRRGGRLATLDSGLARLHGDVALLLPR
ncbi:MAG: VapC toxin family PIN domain ribonuclease [Acidobacteria bacterium]|nr:VapC toxin family PIN domain ribonuclease [Acidobacteriota bacterium]